MAAADAGFGSHSSGDSVGVLKEDVQERPGTRAFLSDFIGAVNLLGNLALAHDQTVQTGGDAEQVMDRFGIRMAIEQRPQSIDWKMMKLGKELGDQVGIQRCFWGRAAQVDLDPVARAQNHCFASISAGEIIQGARDHLFVERHALADLHWSFLKIAADRQQSQVQSSKKLTTNHTNDTNKKAALFLFVSFV
jgi:hypothetical protein